MNNADIAKQSYLAYVLSDRAANEAVIAADFHFTSPLDNRLDRATYFHRYWPNNESIVDFQFVRVIESADEVVVTYQGTNANGKKFRNTEVLTIRDGQIVEAEVYFGWNLPHEAPLGGFVESM